MDLSAVDAEMRRRVEAGQGAGIATAVVSGDDAVEACHGMLDMERAVPVQPDSLMRIYSLTKPVVAAAVMLLRERGSLRLDDPVRDWIPSFGQLHVVTGEPLAADITVRHLLTHTAGLANWFEEGAAQDACREANLLSPILLLRNPLPTTVELISGIPLCFQPGTRWQYSLSFEVLGYLIELISKRSFGEFLREEIFTPLGMVDTGFKVPATALDRLGPLYGAPVDRVFPVLDPRIGSPFTDPPVGASGGGGLISTLRDYLRFARMLAAGGTLDGVHILEPDSVRTMTTNQLHGTAFPIRWFDEPDESTAYGLGLGIGVGEPARFGWGGASGGQMWIFPDHDLIAIGLTQSMHDFTVSNAFVEAVITSCLGLDAPSPVF